MAMPAASARSWAQTPSEKPRTAAAPTAIGRAAADQAEQQFVAAAGLGGDALGVDGLLRARARSP